MAKKFISVLGTSEYRMCTYAYCNKTYSSRFVQEAILNLCFGKIGPLDKILIFTTKSAYNNNWIDTNKIKRGLRYNLIQNKVQLDKLDDIKKIVSDEVQWEDKEEVTIGLESILRNEYPDIPNENIIQINIDEGKSEDQLWNIFKKIYENINNDDEIVFDITHGFRSIPMQVLTVINYAKTLKQNVKVEGIYYGAFEARDKNTNVAPIFDLTVYNKIFEWTSAVKQFTKYGDGNAIWDLYESLRRDSAKKGDLAYSKSGLYQVVNAIKSFTNCIRTSRGRDIKIFECENDKQRSKRSIYEAAVYVKKNLENLQQQELDSIKPLEPLLNEIEKVIEPFTSSQGKNINIGMETVKWCIQYGMIQQGYTALDETVKTYICNKYGLSDIGKENRDDIVKAAMNYNFHKDVNKNTNNDKEDDEKKDRERKYMKLASIMPEDLYSLCSISVKRNDISHFGFTNDNADYENLKNNLIKEFKKFNNIVKKYESEDLKETLKKYE